LTRIIFVITLTLWYSNIESIKKVKYNHWWIEVHTTIHITHRGKYNFIHLNDVNNICFRSLVCSDIKK